MLQWLRKTSVNLSGGSGGVVINPGNVSKAEMRVQFKVSKGISGSPNTFEVKIWNLSPSHRNSVGKELDLVQIEAGYMPPLSAGNVGIIAKGRVRDVQHDREGPDIITTISCGDGDKAYRKATISKTLPKGTSVEGVVEELYKSLEAQGIDRGEFKFPEDIREFKRPYSMCGSAIRELNVLGRGNRFYWSIQNEVFEIIPSDGNLPGTVLISPQTGMIGTPSITDNGVKVKTLLNPEIRPNRLVKVDSQTLQMNSQGDTYRVSQLEFSGDNTEGEFIASIHGESVSEGKVDEGAPK